MLRVLDVILQELKQYHMAGYYDVWYDNVYLLRYTKALHQAMIELERKNGGKIVLPSGNVTESIEWFKTAETKIEPLCIEPVDTGRNKIMTDMVSNLQAKGVTVKCL